MRAPRSKHTSSEPATGDWIATASPGIPDAVHALVRTATSLTASPATMAAATGVSEGAWTSCCAAAASELRDNLLRSGLPDQPILEHAFLATMIRLGVVLRMIDELAEQSVEAAAPR